MLQAQVGASPKNEVEATLVAVPTGPIAQGGSRKRSYAAFAVLTIIARTWLPGCSIAAAAADAAGGQTLGTGDGRAVGGMPQQRSIPLQYRYG